VPKAALGPRRRSLPWRNPHLIHTLVTPQLFQREIFPLYISPIVSDRNCKKRISPERLIHANHTRVLRLHGPRKMSGRRIELRSGRALPSRSARAPRPLSDGTMASSSSLRSGKARPSGFCKRQAQTLCQSAVEPASQGNTTISRLAGLFSSYNKISSGGRKIFSRTWGG
jgi:hypothetical protein